MRNVDIEFGMIKVDAESGYCQSWQGYIYERGIAIAELKGEPDQINGKHILKVNIDGAERKLNEKGYPEADFTIWLNVTASGAQFLTCGFQEFGLNFPMQGYKFERALTNEKGEEENFDAIRMTAKNIELTGDAKKDKAVEGNIRYHEDRFGEIIAENDLAYDEEDYMTFATFFPEAEKTYEITRSQRSVLNEMQPDKSKFFQPKPKAKKTAAKSERITDALLTSKLRALKQKTSEAGQAPILAEIHSYDLTEEQKKQVESATNLLIGAEELPF